MIVENFVHEKVPKIFIIIYDFEEVIEFFFNKLFTFLIILLYHTSFFIK